MPLHGHRHTRSICVRVNLNSRHVTIEACAHASTTQAISAILALVASVNSVNMIQILQSHQTMNNILYNFNSSTKNVRNL